VRLALFSPDGAELLTVPAVPWSGQTGPFQPEGTFDYTLRVWRVADGICLRVLRGHTGAVFGAAWSPDGRVVSWSDDSTVRLWNADGSARVWRMPVPSRAATVSPDGRFVAANGIDNRSYLLHPDDDLARRIPLHDGAVTIPHFSPDGSLLTAGLDGFLIARDPVTGAVRARAEPAGGEPIHGLLVHPRDGRIMIFTQDGPESRPVQIRILDRSFSVLLGPVPYKGPFELNSFDDEWKIRIASGGNHGWVHDVATDRELAVLTGHEYLVEFACITRDGSKVLTCSRDRTAALWNSRPGLGFRTEMRMWGPDCVAVSQDGTRLLSWDAKGLLVLRRRADDAVLASLEVTGGRPEFVWISPNPDLVLWASRSESDAVFWNTATGAIVRVPGRTPGLATALFSPDGRHAALYYHDQKARIAACDGSSVGPEVQYRHAHIRVLSPGGRFMALVHAPEALIQIVDASTGARVADLVGHNGFAMYAAFLPDGRIATTAMDASIRVWNPETGAVLAAGRWPRIQECWIRTSPDSRFVLCGAGWEARIYRSDTMEEVATMPSSWPVHDAYFTPDSSALAVHFEGRTRQFPLDPLPVAIAATPRELTPVEHRLLLASSAAETLEYSRGYLRRHPRASHSQATAEKAASEGRWADAVASADEAATILPAHPSVLLLAAQCRLGRAATGSAEGAAADREVAMACLARAVEAGLRGIAELRRLETFASVAADPRWDALQAREKEVGR
jgi:WD40 repeat protein